VEVELMTKPTVRRTKNLADAYVTVAPIDPSNPNAHAIDCAGCGPIGVSKTRIAALGTALKHAARCDIEAPQN
jgi:hypothetical protein